MPSGLWLYGMRYFVLEGRPPAHSHDSTHFFSEIPHLRLASDRGWGIARTSIRSEYLCNSTQWVSCSSAAIFSRPHCEPGTTNFNDNAQSDPTQRGDMLLRLEGIMLPRAMSLQCTPQCWLCRYQILTWEHLFKVFRSGKPNRKSCRRRCGRRLGGGRAGGRSGTSCSTGDEARRY